MRESVRKYLTLVEGWRRVTCLLWQTDRISVVGLSALTCLSGLAPSGSLWIGRHIIDAVLAPQSGGSDANSWLQWLLTLGGLSLAAAAVTQLSTGLTTLFAAKVAQRLGVLLLEKAAVLDLTHFERSEFYDTLQRAQSEGAVRPMAVLTLQLQLIQNAVSLSIVAAVIIAFKWLAFAFLVATVLPQIMTQFKLAHAGYELQRQLTTIRRTQQYYGSLLTTSEYIKEVILFGASDYIVSRYEQLFRSLYGANKGLAVRAVVWSTAASVATMLSYLVFYGYVLHLATGRQITIGQVILLAGSYQLSQSSLTAVIRSISGLYEHTLHLNHIWEFLNLRPQLATRSVVQAPMSMANSLELRHVSFRYPGKTRWILRDFNLRLHKNECVAVVGRNGCGKTTLAKLLCRLYDPEDGEIVLNGLDIRQFDAREYRTMVSAVFQDAPRYHLSVRENIGLSRHQLMHDDARVHQAALLSGAASVVERLTERYDTVLGTYFGRGHLLSGGEWQKISIARALMRDAPIIVLDEPTVSLDPESEAKWLETLRGFCQERLAVLITHRLAHARIADRVVVLDDGCIKEQGSHSELMCSGGWYASWAAHENGMREMRVYSGCASGNACDPKDGT